MKACFVTGGSLNAFWQEKLEKTAKCDLLAFGFNGLGLVSYKRELEGKSEFFHDAAGLSRATGGVLVCGCDTDTYGVFRHSALVAEKGRILYYVLIVVICAAGGALSASSGAIAVPFEPSLLPFVLIGLGIAAFIISMYASIYFYSKRDC